MKKKLLAVAVVGALASPAAFAQTLYGIVDLGYQNSDYSDGDVNKDFMVQGQHSGSRLGVRGSEDLAGGTYAMYQIEFNIQADNGDPAATGTQRLTMVGLGSKAWGEFTLGQQYTHSFHTIAPGSASAYATFTSTAGLIPELTRASNSFKYSSPVMGGFSVGALWSPSGTGTTEPTADTAEANYWDAAIRYTPGPFGVAVSHAKSSTELAAVEAESELTIFSANWDNRAFGIYGTFWQGEADAGGTTLAEPEGWALSGVARFGGRHELYALWGMTEDSLIDDSEGSVLAIVYQHVMSKRTRFYAGYATSDNDPAGTAVPTALQGGPAAGYDARGIQLGIVHTF